MAKCCPNKMKKAKNYLFWNGSIRLFITNYINVLLLSLLNLIGINDNSEYNDNNYDGVVASNWFSIIFFVHCIVVPIVLSLYYYHNEHRIKDKDFDDKVGSLI